MNLRPIFFAILTGSVIFACQQQDKLEKKKAELKELKTKQHEINEKIVTLEEEISKLDPEFAKRTRKATLVTTIPVKNKNFEHYIEVSGSVESKKNVVLSTENMGNIISIPVTEGTEVAKGRLIARQDDDVLQRQLAQLETQYDLAKRMYEKQANLWEQKIGSEVQYLEAKNKKENLEQQIESVKTQISKTYITAPFTGVIDEIFVNEGVMASPGTQIARIVNNAGMYVTADVSEAYIGSFDKGDSVIIDFPSINKSVKATITSVGRVIDEQNRTFKVEIKLPDTDFSVKPNLISVVKIKDFEKPEATVIPTNLIQQDKQGEYVYIINTQDSLKTAKKAHIERGKTYKNKTLIVSGLNSSDVLVDQGFKDVTDGTPVRVVESVL